VNRGVGGAWKSKKKGHENLGKKGRPVSLGHDQTRVNPGKRKAQRKKGWSGFGGGGKFTRVLVCDLCGSN